MVTNEKRYGVVDNDYDPGNYIEGSSLEGRIDWDGVEQLENHALGLMEDWSDRFNRVVCCFSGGVDSLVPLHLAKRVGFDGAFGEVLNAKTPQEYPSNQEYIEGMCARWGFDMHFWTVPQHGMEFLQEDPEYRVFPPYEEHMRQGDKRQRSMHRWQPDQHDMRVYGRRIQHNANSITYCDERDGVYQGNPIRDWQWEQVLAYADKHNLPISPAYRHDWPYGIGEQWHRRFRTGPSGEPYETVPQCWWTVREYCLNWGYTDFWKYLDSWFDNAATDAAAYASQENLTLTAVEDGYELGCDTRPNPVHVGLDAGEEGEPESFRHTATETGQRIYEHLSEAARR